MEWDGGSRVQTYLSILCFDAQFSRKGSAGFRFAASQVDKNGFRSEPHLSQDHRGKTEFDVHCLGPLTRWHWVAQPATHSQLSTIAGNRPLMGATPDADTSSVLAPSSDTSFWSSHLLGPDRNLRMWSETSGGPRSHNSQLLLHQELPVLFLASTAGPLTRVLQFIAESAGSSYHHPGSEPRLGLMPVEEPCKSCMYFF